MNDILKKRTQIIIDEKSRKTHAIIFSNLRINKIDVRKIHSELLTIDDGVHLLLEAKWIDLDPFRRGVDDRREIVQSLMATCKEVWHTRR